MVKKKALTVFRLLLADDLADIFDTLKNADPDMVVTVYRGADGHIGVSFCGAGDMAMVGLLEFGKELLLQAEGIERC